MKLSVKNRFAALGLLPRESSYVVRKEIQRVAGELELSQEEIAIVEAKVMENGNISWNMTKDPMKDVQLGVVAKLELSKALRKLDEEGKLKDEHVELYEAIVLEPKNEIK